MGKTLVAYFSATGQTRRLAQTLAEAAQADVFEIVPEVPYTPADLDWNDKGSRSTMEMNDPESRPAIASSIATMDDYDTVFVGFPIWWYVAPTIISTFLECYDFSSKTVVPFATSGGSGMGESEDILKACCPADTRWLPGRRMSSTVNASSLKQWIKELGV